MAERKNNLIDAQWEIFFECLENGMTADRAAAQIGYEVSWLYKIRKRNPEIAGRWQMALINGRLRRADKLEHVAMDRAEKGEAVLLIFLLKRLRPEIYSDDETQRDGPERTLRIEDVDGYNEFCNGLLESLQPFPDALRAVISMLEKMKDKRPAEDPAPKLLN